MITIQKLIIRECLVRTLIVLTAILSLFIVFDALDAFRGAISDNKSLIFLFWQLVIEIPSNIYELLPLAVLLGNIWAISLFAKSSELTVMRVSGYLVKNLLILLFSFGLFFGLIGIVFDEVINNYAKQLHSQTFSQKQTKDLKQVWTRYQQYFIRIENLNQNQAKDIVSIKLAENFKSIESIIKAKSGEYIQTNNPNQNNQGYWNLNHVEEIIINQKITSDQLFSNPAPLDTYKELLPKIAKSPYKINFYQQKVWENAPDVDFFVDQDLEPKDLKLSQLIPLYKFNLDNLLSFEALAVVMWKKINYPLVIALMAIIGIPFCLKTGRQIESTFRLLIGVIIGIVFFVFQGIFANLGIITLPPLIGVLLPIILFFIFTITAVWLVQKR